MIDSDRFKLFHIHVLSLNRKKKSIRKIFGRLYVNYHVVTTLQDLSHVVNRLLLVSIVERNFLS
jgi:hypothetical protein